MKDTLEQARTEVDKIIKERNDAFPLLIQSGEMHRDVAKRRYNRLRLVRFALEAMTQKEWQAFQKRYLNAKAQQLQVQQQRMKL